MICVPSKDVIVASRAWADGAATRRAAKVRAKARRMALALYPN